MTKDFCVMIAGNQSATSLDKDGDLNCYVRNPIEKGIIHSNCFATHRTIISLSIGVCDFFCPGLLSQLRL